MLRHEPLIEWFADQGIDIPGFKFTLPDEGPDRAYAVAISGGLGLELEDAEDKPTFQVLTRGPSALESEASGEEAEELAIQLDRTWIDANPMFSIGGFQVKGKGRLTGPPAFVAIDDRRRTLLAATYWCRIVR